METVIVSNSQFYSHYPRQIPKGSVNAEQVEIRLDKSWDGLTVRIHWLNVASNVERKPLLERDKPNTIPWEVLTDLGELRMGLVGMDGETVIKPTIWLTYGYVADGVDPESGSDPQPPTPSWEQQMVEQATQANQAAQEAKGYAQQVAESIENAGPYAQEAKEAAEAAKASETAAKGAADTATQQATKAQEAVASIGNAVEQAQQAATDAGAAKSAAETAQTAAAQFAVTAQTAATTASQAAQTAQGAATQAGQYLATVEADAQAAANAAAEAKKSQEAAQTAAQEAGNARDQANAAATTAQGHATAASTAKDAAEQAAATAGSAQSGAAQSAQAAANSASAAQAAQQAAEAAAAVLPKPTREDAGKVPMVNPEGTGYVFGEAGAGGELLLAEYVHKGNQEIYPSSIDWETGVIECTEPHGLTEATQAMLVWNDWMSGNVYANATAMPIEWTSLNQNLFLVPTDDTHVMVVGDDKSTPVTVNASDDFNKNVDGTKIHFEIPVGFRISDIPELYTKVQLTILGVVMGNNRYRYINFACRKKDGKVIWVDTRGLLSPPYFGVITKPRHGLLTSHNITLELNNVVGGSFLYSNYFAGRRNNYVGFPGETYTEIKRTIQPYNLAEVLGVTGINVDPSNAVWANGTRIRLYGLCKGGEHN